MVRTKNDSQRFISAAAVKALIGVLIIVFLMTLVPFNAHAAGRVRLSNTKLTVLIGGMERQLTVYNTKKTVTWSSSKPKVATVTSDGTIKPKKEGKTTITAKVGKKTLKCKVIVEEFTPTWFMRDYNNIDGVTYTEKDAKKYTKWRNKWMKKYLSKDMPDQQIVFIAAKWIVDHADYERDLVNPFNETDFFRVFKIKKGTCYTYTLSLNFLLAPTGVNSIFVYNWGTNHSWNQVEIDGEWYNVDTVQIDDTEGSPKAYKNCFAAFLFPDASEDITGRAKEYTGYHHDCTSRRFVTGKKIWTYNSPWLDGTWINL